MRRTMKRLGWAIDWSRGLHAPARLLPLDAVAVPALLRARTGLPQGGAGQLVPEGSDGGRERVRGGRAVRAVRYAGRAAQPDPVVLQGDRLRRRAARVRAAAGRMVARADEDDPAQLDRAERGRGHPFPGRRAGHRHRRFHDPSGHPVRRDLLRRRIRAPVRRGARERRGRRSTHGTPGRGERRSGPPTRPRPASSPDTA